MALCEQRTAKLFTLDDGEVTCPKCLAWQGRYVSLFNLREHQLYMQLRHNHAKGAPFGQGYK